MAQLIFVVPGLPSPWTVWVKRGPPPAGFERMRAYQETIQAYARRAWGDRDSLRGPVHVDTEFYLPSPGVETARKYRFPIRAGGHDPDLDNLRKVAIDAIQGIIVVNDVLVVSGAVLKCWSPADSPGETLFRVREL